MEIADIIPLTEKEIQLVKKEAGNRIKVQLTEEERQIVWQAFGKQDVRIVLALEQLLEFFLYSLKQLKDYRTIHNIEQISPFERRNVAPYYTTQKTKKAGEYAAKLKELLSSFEVEHLFLFYGSKWNKDGIYHTHKEQLLSVLEVITKMVDEVPNVNKNATLDWSMFREEIIKIWAAVHERMPTEKMIDEPAFQPLINVINSIIKREIPRDYVPRPGKLTANSFRKTIKKIRQSYAGEKGHLIRMGELSLLLASDTCDQTLKSPLK